MKVSQILFVASVLRDLQTIPQADLTPEKVVAVVGDKLEGRYPTNFNRAKFFETAGVSSRLAQDAEARLAPVPRPEALPITPTTASGHVRPFAPSSGRIPSDNPWGC